MHESQPHSSNQGLSSRYWGFAEEVSLAGMPKPSLQGCIDGVFWNKHPIMAADSQGAE